jgi:membrane-bound lytic murein transglycosylase D
MTTPEDGPFDLHLPVGAGALYAQRITEIPEEKRRYWRFHKLAAGETIQDIARNYRVSASEIAFVNQLSSTDAELTGTEALIIPVAPASAPSTLRNALYHSRRGDTLVTISDRFGVTVDQLRRWNHLTGTTITTGRSLYVTQPAQIARASHGRRKRGAASVARTASHHNAKGTSNTANASHQRSSHASVRAAIHTPSKHHSSVSGRKHGTPRR